jgi:hypothetical protein
MRVCFGSVVLVIDDEKVTPWFDLGTFKNAKMQGNDGIFAKTGRVSECAWGMAAMSAAAADMAITAMLQWLSRFDCNQDRPCYEAQDLLSGVTLFDTLASLAPEYFDSGVIQRGDDGNPMTCAANMSKLIAGMTALLMGVGMPRLDLSAVLNVPAIARGGTGVEMVNLLRCVAFCAVHTGQRQDAIQNIMALEEVMQGELMVLISSGQQMFAALSAAANASTDTVAGVGPVQSAAIGDGGPSMTEAAAGAPLEAAVRQIEDLQHQVLSNARDRHMMLVLVLVLLVLLPLPLLLLWSFLHQKSWPSYAIPLLVVFCVPLSSRELCCLVDLLAFHFSWRNFVAKIVNKN